jgi:restriction endonuclease Mrr
MAALKPQFVANLLVELGNNLAYKKLEEVVYAILLDQMPKMSNEEKWDFIDLHKKDIANELFNKENDSLIDGISLNFDISEEDGEYYIKFIDKPEIDLLRSLRINTPSNFEHFCKKILNKLDGKSTVTGGSYDGGIDFISSDLRLNGLAKASTKGSNIIVIGQAKRYKDGNHITEKDLREFIGACVKRIDEFKKTRSDQYGIFQPTILAFWTTSDFHTNAKTFAKDMGIWYLNGVALCQLALQLKVE